MSALIGDFTTWSEIRSPTIKTKLTGKYITVIFIEYKLTMIRFDIVHPGVYWVNRKKYNYEKEVEEFLYGHNFCVYLLTSFTFCICEICHRQ